MLYKPHLFCRVVSHLMLFCIVLFLVPVRMWVCARLFVVFLLHFQTPSYSYCFEMAIFQVYKSILKKLSSNHPACLYRSSYRSGALRMRMALEQLKTSVEQLGQSPGGLEGERKAEEAKAWDLEKSKEIQRVLDGFGMF